jgi:poly(glycerol-phosphate) alpha-glucosyltransferase
VLRVQFIVDLAGRAGGGLGSSASGFARGLRGLQLESGLLARRQEHLAEDSAGTWPQASVRTFEAVGGGTRFGFSPALLRRSPYEGFDVLHVHGLWTFSSFAAAVHARRFAVPLVVTTHGMLDDWALRQSPFAKRIALATWQGWTLRSASCIHALTPREAQAIRALGFRTPIAVIPNGVEVPADAGEAPWTNAVHAGKRVLLYFGRIHEKKGILRLLEAWSLLSTTAPELRAQWHLVVAGFGEEPFLDSVRTRARELGIADGVLFAGPQHGARKWATLRACDALVLPSFSEGLPMVVLEAWACGRAVGMSPQCNLDEGFDAKAAVRLDPASAESLAAGLRGLLSTSREALAAMGENGRALARTSFEPAHVASELAAVYSWVTGRGERPACVLQC